MITRRAVCACIERNECEVKRVEGRSGKRGNRSKQEKDEVINNFDAAH